MKSSLLRGAAAATAAVLIAGGGTAVANAAPVHRAAAPDPGCATSLLNLGNLSSLLSALGDLGSSLSLTDLLALVTGLSRTQCTGLPVADLLDLQGLGLNLDEVLGVLQPGTHLLGLTPISADVNSPLVGLVVVAGITDGGTGTLDVLVNGEPVIEGLPLVNIAGIGVGANLSLLPSLVGDGTVTVRYNGTVGGGGSTTSDGIAVNAGLLTSTFTAASAPTVTYPAKPTISYALTGPTIDPIAVKNPLLDLNNLTDLTGLVVTPVEPQGSVVAKIGAATVGTGEVGADGTGTIALTSSTPGAQAVTLTYQPGGLSSLLHSPSSQSLTANILKAMSSKTSGATAATYPAGSKATVTLGGVTGGVKPTGTIRYTYLGGTVGTVAVSATGSTAVTLPGAWQPASRTVLWSYSGDGRYLPTSGSLVVTNNKGASTVTGTGNTVAYGKLSTVAITARGAGVAPGGTLALYSPSGVRYALTNLVGGKNSGLALAKYLPVGTHRLTVKYFGNAFYNGSSSTATFTVTRTAPKVSVAIDSRTYPGKVVLRPTFASVLTSTPTGTVQVLKGSTVVGSASVKYAKAPVQLGALAKGTHSFTLRYSGDGTFTPISVPVTVTVR